MPTAKLQSFKAQTLKLKIRPPRKTYYDRQAIWLSMFTKTICVYSALISVNNDANDRFTCIYDCALSN